MPFGSVSMLSEFFVKVPLVCSPLDKVRPACLGVPKGMNGFERFTLHYFVEKRYIPATPNG